MTPSDIVTRPVGLKVDHIVIRTLARDALVAAVAEATGLPALDGFAEGDHLHSRGVRFAGGPFLDVFQAEAPQAVLILRGAMDEVGRLAAAQGWAVRLLPREPALDGAYPWSMVLFRRGQGLMTQISTIDYDPDPRSWASPSFDRPLYPIQPAPARGATLDRVWLGAEEGPRAARDLRVLGYEPAGPVDSGFWPHTGEAFRGQGVELVLCAGRDSVVRFDVTSGGGPPREVALLGGPVMVLDETI